MTTNRRRRPSMEPRSPHIAHAALWSLTLLALAVSAVLVHPSPVTAQEDVVLAHTYSYGTSARFRITAPGTPNGTAAVLTLRINDTRTESHGAAFEAGTAVVDRDLAASPLPPFASITTWWTYTAADGVETKSKEQMFRYSDDRYDWETASVGDVRLHWITGDRGTMEQALDVARASLDEITTALQAERPASVDIYVYPSRTDLVHAMQLGGHSWVGGVAYPELGVVLVDAPANAEGLLAMQADVPHELAHLVMYDMLGPQGYSFVPTWLEEGLATHFEARPDPEYARALETARGAEALYALPDLCVPFPDNPLQARLAYAQSASVVRYLRETHGWSAIRGLLHNYGDGQSCEAGTERVTGSGLAELDADWRAWYNAAHPTGDDGEAATEREPVTLELGEAGPWLMLMGALAAPGLLLVGVFALRKPRR